MCRRDGSNATDLMIGDAPLCESADGQDDHDADTVRDRPKRSLSLREARPNLLRIRTCGEKSLNNVRSPHERNTHRTKCDTSPVM